MDVRKEMQEAKAAPDVLPAPETGSATGGGGTGLALVVGFFALAGLFLAIAAIVVAFNRPKESVAAAATNGEVDGTIQLTEFSIKGDLTLPPGQVMLTVQNNGSQVHNFEVVGLGKTADIQPGQSAMLHLGQVVAGDYPVRCNISGHVDAGMKDTLKVEAGAAAPGTASAAGTDGTTATTMSWTQMDQMMLDSLKAFPAATEGKGNQAMTPIIAAD